MIGYGINIYRYFFTDYGKNVKRTKEKLGKNESHWIYISYRFLIPLGQNRFKTEITFISCCY